MGCSKLSRVERAPFALAGRLHEKRKPLPLILPLPLVTGLQKGLAILDEPGPSLQDAQPHPSTPYLPLHGWGQRTQRGLLKFVFCLCSALLVHYYDPAPYILHPANPSCHPSQGAPAHRPHSPALECRTLTSDISTKEKRSRSIRHRMPGRDRLWELALPRRA